MNTFKNWAADRARERSTWLGLIGVASSLAAAFFPNHTNEIAQAGVIAGSLVATVTRDNKA